MKTIEYHDVVDKSKWPRGPWDNEPDKIQWQDEAAGLPCLIIRNHFGALCGYVGIDPSYPLYGTPYDDHDRMPDFEVHWGLTFSGACSNGNEAQSICHVVESGEDDRIWWLGFDCHHAFDMAPGMTEYRQEFLEKHPEFIEHGDTYRDVAYVKAECASLAKQLKEIANGKQENNPAA